MRIAEIQPGEYDRIRDMHRQMKMAYPMVDMSDPLIVVKQALFDESDSPICAGLVRITGEAFLFLDTKLSKTGRIHAIANLHVALSESAKRKGFDQVSCWLPPDMPAGFVKLLERLGWKRSPWENWTVNL